ncbi:hypothetical protein MTO96_026668 [Rhipicephalus appendiculatus]
MAGLQNGSTAGGVGGEGTAEARLPGAVVGGGGRPAGPSRFVRANRAHHLWRVDHYVYTGDPSRYTGTDPGVRAWRERFFLIGGSRAGEIRELHVRSKMEDPRKTNGGSRRI